MTAPRVIALPGTIIHIEFFESWTVPEVKAFLTQCEEITLRARRERQCVVSVSNISLVKPSSAEVRATFAKGIDRLRAQVPGTWVGEGVIATSALARTVIAGVWWWLKADENLERQTFATERDALSWARELLSRRNPPG